MSDPTTSDYLNACAAAYAEVLSLNGAPYTQPNPPLGWSFLQVNGKIYTTASDANIPNAMADGCFGVVLVNNSNPNEMVVAFAGTVPGYGTTYSDGTEEADLAIYAGTDPKAFTDAATFVADLKNSNQNASIFLTGHSLGGSEAEYAALTDSKEVTAGATFGATGLPGYSGTSGSANFVNYVERGDPIGNYGSDTLAKNDYHLSKFNHYGSVVPTGPVYSTNQFTDPGVALANVGAALFTIAEDPYQSVATIAVSGVPLAAMAYQIKYHMLEQYQSDLTGHPSYLGVPSGSILDPTSVLTSIDALIPNGSQDMAAAVVTSNDSIKSPDFTIIVPPASSQFTIEQNQAITGVAGAQSDFGDPILFQYSLTSFDITSASFTDPNTGAAVDDVIDQTTGEIDSCTINNPNGTSSSTTFSYDILPSKDATEPDRATSYYSSTNDSGSLIDVDDEYESGSTFISYSGNIATANYYTGPNGTGALSNTTYTYDVTQADAGGTKVSYNTAAAQLNMNGVSGGVLAAVNGGTSGTATPLAPSLDIPIAVSAAYTIDSGVGYDVTFSNPSDVVSYVLNVATGNYVAIQFDPDQVSRGDMGDGYDYVVSSSGAVLAVYSVGELSSTSWSSGTGLTLKDAAGDIAVWSAAGTLTSKSGSGVLSDGSFATAPKTYALDSGGSVTGQGSFNTASLNGSDDLPDAAWTIAATSATAATIAGGVGSGFTGTATLSNVQAVELGDVAYGLQIADGGSYTFETDDSLTIYGNASDIIAEVAGTTNTLVFDNYGTSDYWHVTGRNDAVTLGGGIAEIYMAGAASAYTYAYSNSAALALTGSAIGTMDIYNGGGTAEITFADGTVWGFGDMQDNVNFATSYNTFTLDGGTQHDYGYTYTSGATTIGGTANFTSGNSLADNSWDIYEDSAGDAVMDGTDAGYDGVATLTGITTVNLDYGSAGSAAYTLLETPVSGGAVSTSGYSATIVVEAKGKTDTVTVGNGAATYWQVNGINDTADIASGSAELYLPGDLSDYTVSYNGATGKTTLTDSVANRTGTLTINAGAYASGELNFADGSVIGLNKPLDDVGLDGATANLGSYGTLADWTFSKGANGAVIANGGADGYGTTTLYNVPQVELGGQYYSYINTNSVVNGATIATTVLYAGTVWDGPGADTLQFEQTGTSTWDASGGSDTASLFNGVTEIDLAGPRSNYTITNATPGKIVVTDTTGTEGVKTINIEVGKGELVFGDGTKVGLGITTDTTDYTGTGYDMYYIASGFTTTDGPAGYANIAVFSSGDATPDATWQMQADGAGDVIIAGKIGSSFSGSAEFTNIVKVTMGTSTYALDTTTGAAGATDTPLTIGTPASGIAGTIIVDGAGNDTLTFSGTGTSYWHVGAGNNTATLSAGTTDIYFTGASSQYTETFNGSNLLTVKNTATSATEALTLSGGSGQLIFASDGSIALGTNSTGDSVEYGGSANDTFTLTSQSAAINGGGGTDTVVFSSSTVAPTGAWSIAENASAQIVASGASVGYTGTATLTSIEQLKIAGNTYALAATPNAGGSTTIATPGSGIAGTIVVDGAGADALTFSGTGTSYWHVGAGNNTATLSAGTTEIYFTGASSQYTETFNGTNVLTVKNTATSATETLTLSGGSGELVFASGSSVALGTTATGDSVEYGGSANDTFTLTSQSAAINGGGGTDTVVFSSSTVAPTGAWSIAENASSQVVVSATSVGYTGTATLTSIEQLKMSGNTYSLVATANAGGSATIATPGTGITGTIVVDGAGADALTFSGTGTSYWHVGSGNNTATLSAGTTEIYFTGASSQYTETFSGTNVLTVKNTATSATETLTLSGGSGELVFASGSNIALNKSGDTTIYGGSTVATLTGTTGADTIYAGSGADTIIGAGGADTYKIGAGTTTETIQNGISTSNTAAGNLDFTGSIDAANLWFVHSGNNLVVDVLGTTRQTVLQNWFATGDAYAQTSEIVSADALKLDTSLNNLITAMATFSTNNSGFNPQTTTDTTLTNSTFYGTLSATDKSSWHS